MGLQLLPSSLLYQVSRSVAVLTTVTKEQKAEIIDQKAEIAALKDRMLQMEMALAEVLRNQSSEGQVSSTN